MPRAERRSGEPAERYLDWHLAESSCRRLAALLREAVGADLERAAFAGIPRGGTFVLGMLSYLLDLKPTQVLDVDASAFAASGEGPLVLVDDCALSGARLARALARVSEAAPSRPVLAVHLYSHPGLRTAVLASEPRVEHCLAAADLSEREGLSGDARAAFEALWRDRLPGRRYWLGPVEPVAFPWSEPEWVWWNEREGRLEDGWHRVSPWRCLRFRAELALPELPSGTAAARGPLDLAPGAWWKLDGERLLVAGPDGRLAGFRDVGFDAWRALLAFGDRERSWRHLASRYEVDAEELRRDVDELVDDLLARGLLAG